jgi:antitoxin VapB
MHLNIKNHEAHALARQLAKASGKSLTEVVTHALRLELARSRNAQTMTQALMQISKDSAGRFKPPLDTLDHAALLYDDKGLPR